MDTLYLMVALMIVTAVLVDVTLSNWTGKSLPEHVLGEKYQIPKVRNAVAAGWVAGSAILLFPIFHVTGTLK